MRIPFRQIKMTDPAAFLEIGFGDGKGDTQAVGMKARLTEAF